MSIKELKKLSHNALNTHWRSVSAEMHFVFFNERLFFNLLTQKCLSKLTEIAPHPIVIFAGCSRVTKFFCVPTFCYQRRDSAENGVQGWYEPIEIPHIFKMLRKLKSFKFSRSLSLYLRLSLTKAITLKTLGGVALREVKLDVLLSASLQQT